MTLRLLPGVILSQLISQLSWSAEMDRFFSIENSIEMTRFSDPDARNQEAKAKFSPDGRYCAVVTSRGLIQADKIESTLWVFGADEISAFLQAPDDAQGPTPRVAARLAAVPKSPFTNSYGSIISDLAWLPDSKTMLFLGQDSDGNRQLYRANSPFRSVKALTSKGYDVSSFVVAHDSIIYEATRASEGIYGGDAINRGAREVTGMPLMLILFPETQNDLKYKELWTLRKNGNLRVTTAEGKAPLHLLNHFPDMVSVSPDGRSAVVLAAVDDIQPEWESYEPAYSYLKFRANSREATAQFNQFRPTRYTLVDLRSGKTSPLVNAPNAWAAGYADPNEANWSSDGKRLLLTNTFLPLAAVDESERSKRLRPCAVAVFNAASGQTSCLAFSTYTNKKKSSLLDASFSKTDDEVLLHFWNSPDERTEELYRHHDDTWTLVSSSSGHKPERLSAPGLVSIVVRQDLNTPPALWAIDGKTGKTKRVWDPNPQLQAVKLGDVSIFRWKDKTGYEWVAGLVKPPDYISGRRYPLVMQTHGFNQNEFMTDGAYTTAFAARPLASAGMIVLQMRQKRDRQVTSYEAPDQILGFESAIDSLASEGVIDANRVGIIGFSRTCYYVESALIHDPTRFAAATIADGVDESYMQYLEFSVGRSGNEAEQIYGTQPFAEGLKTWVDQAPGFQLERIRTPLRIEAISPPSILQEWEIYASLSRQSKPVDLIYIPDGQHILQQPVERLASQQGNVDWFRFWLKGEEDPSGAKREQYGRWEKLCDLQGAQNPYRPTSCVHAKPH